MVGHANNARKFWIEADNSNNSREKVQLYQNAGKEYAKAAEAIDDRVTKVSLMYLSTTATQKAQMIQSIIQQYSTDHVLQLEQVNRTMGKAKPSGPISEVSDNLHDNRIVFKNHQSRLSGINKIPKFTAPSDSNVVKDLLTMENRLNELGLRRDSGTNSGSSRTQLNNIKISSELGESFMVLKPVGSDKSDARVSESISDKRFSQSLIDEASDPYGGGNAVKIKNLSHLSTGSQASKDGSVTSVSSGGSSSSSSSAATGLTAPLSWAANNLMNWGVFGTGASSAGNNEINASGATSQPANTSKDDANHWDEDDFEDPDGALTWNEQSMYVPSSSHNNANKNNSNPSGQKKTSTNSMIGSNVASRQQQQEYRNHYDDLMAQSTISNSNTNVHLTVSAATLHHNNDNDSMSRSTINSINSAAKDNGEGVLNLLNSVKRLGEENAALVARIEHLTRLEDENKKIVTDMEVFRMDYEEKFKRVKKVLKEYATKFPQDGNPASEALNAVAQQQAQEKETAKALADMAAKPVGTSDKPIEDDKRLKDLEKTVNALVARLTYAYDDIKKRDSMIQKLDPSYVPPAMPSRNSSSSSSGRPPSGGPSQSSSRSSSNVPSTRGPTNVAAGTLSPLPLKKQITAPVARHAGTATLEALQQKTKINF